MAKMLYRKCRSLILSLVLIRVKASRNPREPLNIALAWQLNVHKALKTPNESGNQYKVT